MYSLEAAFIEISSVVTMLARKVQMQVPARRETIVIQQSLALVGSCLPYPAQGASQSKFTSGMTYRC